MTMKSITGEDLRKYVSNRLEHLSLNTSKMVKAHSSKDREKVRRMLMGRKRELQLLLDLINHNAVETQSKFYATENYNLKKFGMPCCYKCNGTGKTIGSGEADIIPCPKCSGVGRLKKKRE